MKIEELVEENANGYRTRARRSAQAPGTAGRKRIELGEDADTALSVALDMFEAYLESAGERRNEPFSFAQWMAHACLPLIKLPNGVVVNNPEAVCLFITETKYPAK
jgi:hypothetical protein